MDLIRAKKIEEFEYYFTVKSDPLAIKWSGFASAPDKERLLAHYKSIIVQEDNYLYFLFDNKELIGYTQQKKVSEGVIENTGISILQKHQGLGYAEDLMEMAIKEAQVEGYSIFFGWVSEQNISSVRVIELMGLKRTGETEIRNLPALGRADVFVKYALEL